MIDKTNTSDHAKLMTKLAKVIKATGKVAKNGTNEFQHYKYATEADIVDEIRGALADNQVFIVPTIISHQNVQVDTKNGKGNLTTVIMNFDISDAETGYSITTSFPGQSLDTGDKGLYKAFTGAEKYFLLKTFLISTGDDPEKDGPELAATPATNPTAPVVNNPMMTEFQANKIRDLVSKKGKHELDVSKFTLTAFKIGDWTKISLPQASAVIKKLEETPDLQPTEDVVNVDEIAAGMEAQKSEQKEGDTNDTV